MIPAPISSAIAHLASAEAELSAAREQLRHSVRKAAAAAYLRGDMRTVTQLAHELYWNTEVDTDDLTAAFGVNRQFASEIAGPLLSEIHCAGCSSPVAFASRTHRAKLIAQPAPTTCDRCRESPQREGTARGRRHSALAQLWAEMERRLLVASQGPPGEHAGEGGGDVGTDPR